MERWLNPGCPYRSGPRQYAESRQNILRAPTGREYLRLHLSIRRAQAPHLGPSSCQPSNCLVHVSSSSPHPQQLASMGTVYRTLHRSSEPGTGQNPPCVRTNPANRPITFLAVGNRWRTTMLTEGRSPIGVLLDRPDDQMSPTAHLCNVLGLRFHGCVS